MTKWLTWSACGLVSTCSTEPTCSPSAATTRAPARIATLSSGMARWVCSTTGSGTVSAPRWFWPDMVMLAMPPISPPERGG